MPARSPLHRQRYTPGAGAPRPLLRGRRGQEMPDLQAYGDRMGGQVAILGVNPQEPADVVAPFVHERALTYPILLDGGQIGAAYRVGSLPTTVIVDREGVVRERLVGAL